jgi:hypothetical protein
MAALLDHDATYACASLQPIERHGSRQSFFSDPIKSHATLVVGEVDRAATDPPVGGAQLDRVVLNFIVFSNQARAMFHTVFGLKPLVSPNVY